MSTKGFRRESNGWEPVLHIPRPTANHTAFKELSPEALLIAQQHWDEADKARLDNEAMKARAQAFDESDEGKSAREQMRQMYTG